MLIIDIMFEKGKGLLSRDSMLFLAIFTDYNIPGHSKSNLGKISVGQHFVWRSFSLGLMVFVTFFSVSSHNYLESLDR